MFENSHQFYEHNSLGLLWLTTLSGIAIQQKVKTAVDRFSNYLPGRAHDRFRVETARVQITGLREKSSTTMIAVPKVSSHLSNPSSQLTMVYDSRSNFSQNTPT